MCAAHLGQRLQQRFASGAGAVQRAAGGAVIVDQGKEHVLDGDVFVLQFAHLDFRGAQHGKDLWRRRGLGLGGQRGQRVQRRVDLAAQRLRCHAELAQHGNDDASVLLEQDGEEVLGTHLGVATGGSQSQRGLDRLLRLDRETVGVHRSQSS